MLRSEAILLSDGGERPDGGSAMRSTMAVMLALLLASASAGSAAPSKKKAEFASSEHILRWINGYRLKPEPAKLPAAVKAMSELWGLPRHGHGRHLRRLHGRCAAGKPQARRGAGVEDVSDAARGPGGHRAGDRLLGPSRVEGPDAEVRRAHARAQGADRPVRLRQAADAAPDGARRRDRRRSTRCGASTSQPGPRSRSSA